MLLYLALSSFKGSSPIFLSEGEAPFVLICLQRQHSSDVTDFFICIAISTFAVNRISL